VAIAKVADSRNLPKRCTGIEHLFPLEVTPNVDTIVVLEWKPVQSNKVSSLVNANNNTLKLLEFYMNWSNVLNVFHVSKVDSVEISARRTMFGSSAIAVLFLLIFYLCFDNKGFIVVG